MLPSNTENDSCLLRIITCTVSVEGRDLVERMLQADPLKRIEAADALRHPWITRRAARTQWIENSVASVKPKDIESASCSIS